MGNEDRAAEVKRIGDAAITNADQAFDANEAIKEIAAARAARSAAERQEAVRAIGDAAITNADKPLDFDAAVAEIAAARAARDAANDNDAEDQRAAA